MSIDTAVLAGRVGRLAELDEIELADEALPALGRNPGRIDAAGGMVRWSNWGWPYRLANERIQPVQSASAQ